MTRRWMILLVLLMLVLPAGLYARWIKDRVYLQTDTVGKVEFSHFTHMEKASIGKNCPTCHNEVFHVLAKKNPLFTMEEMATGKSCGSCHDGKKAFSVSGDCTTCHAGDVEINYATAEKVIFSHDAHAGMFGCDDCHPDLFTAQRNTNLVGMAKMADGESCGACHDGSTAFGVKADCGTCHTSAGAIAMQSTVGDVDFIHDDHTGAFGCDECHPALFTPRVNSNQVGMKKMEAGESCGSCHDGSSAFSVKSDCVSCHTNAVDMAMRAKDLGVVPFSHALHTGMFTCAECHPDLFTARANSNQVGMRRMEEGESCGACHDGQSAFAVSGDCSTCHTGSITFKRDVTIHSPVGAIVFGHAEHTGAFGCDDCHPEPFKARADSNRVGMAKMETGESCGACHDGQTAFGVKGDCLTCHQGAQDIPMQSRVGDIVFSHEPHLAAFSCDECHPSLFKAAANSNQVGMKKMEAGQSCGACHDGSTAFGVKGDCLTCHANAVDMTMQAEGIDAVPFSHAVHADMLACGECHPGVFTARANSNQVGMQRMEAGESCGACHDGKAAFDVSGNCVNCHIGGVDYNKTIAVQSSVGVVPFSHISHTGMFGCDDCHPAPFKAKANSNPVGMKKMEAGASCGACHDGKTAFGVKSDCVSCHQGAQKIAMQSPVGVIAFSHQLHTQAFGCDECHPELFKARANSNPVGMKKMEAGASCGACHDDKTAFGVKGDCVTCHSSAVDMAMQTKDVGTVLFSHAVHTEMLGCSECHPRVFTARANSNQVGMKNMEAGASCGACHDGRAAFGVKDDCTSCHAGDITYQSFGKTVFSHAAHIASFGCSECHPKLFLARSGANKRASMDDMKVGQSCGACHDDSQAFGVGKCDACHIR